MKDKFDITLLIGDVNLTLTIRPEEEELLRKAAKQINHAYKDYKERFGNSSSQEVLAKVTLLFAEGYGKLVQQVKELDRTLADFEQELDRQLLG